MSALRWDAIPPADNHESTPQAERPDAGPTAEERVAFAGDDDPARGIVFGVAASLIGFWLPLAAWIALRARG